MVFHFGTFLASLLHSGDTKGSKDQNPMNFSKFLSSASFLIVCAILFAGIASADQITAPVDLGVSLDVSELASLGLPGSFLFTENTMYDYTGYQDVSVISAPVDPSQTNSLDGLSTQVTTVLIGGGPGRNDDGGSDTDVSATPEPKSADLLAGALGGLLAFALTRRVSPAAYGAAR